jgi:hypothetical protein
VSRFLALLVLLPACLPAAAPTAAELTRSLRDAGFDPGECYRVRDLTFQKEDIRVYFTDGYLIFTKPVAGERVAALFSADVEGGDAEVLLFPPDRGERMSMVRFTQSPNLNEHLLTALLIATDGSVDALRARIPPAGGRNEKTLRSERCFRTNGRPRCAMCAPDSSCG